MTTIPTIDLAALSNVIGGKHQQNICIGWCPGANAGKQKSKTKQTQTGGVQVDPTLDVPPLVPGAPE